MAGRESPHRFMCSKYPRMVYRLCEGWAALGNGRRDIFFTFGLTNQEKGRHLELARPTPAWK